MVMARPVSISRDGFRCCRYAVAAMMWVAVLTRCVPLVAVCATIMALSALLTVRRAPLITLWDLTVGKVRPSPPVVVDQNGMRAAHAVATLFMGLPLLWMGLAPARAGYAWGFLTFVAVMKTVGALGYCPVSRGFTCLFSGGRGDCCRFLKRRASGHA